MQIATKEDVDRLESLLKDVLGRLGDGPGSKVEGNADWVNGHQLRETYGWTPQTLQSFRNNGTLKGKKIGGRWYYRSKDVQRLVKE